MPQTVVQVYWYWDDYSGEFYHRIRQPGLALEKTGDYHVINLHLYHSQFPDLALEADLLVIHFVYQPEIRQVIELRRKLSRPTVFEIPDNFLQPGPHVPEEDPHRNPYIRQNLIHYASICDGLQFSSPELERVFGFLNDNHIVLENQVNALDQAPQRPSGFVFGWGGSKGHEADLAYVAPGVIEFCKRRPDAVFAYMGYREGFDRFFGEIPESSKRYRPPGSMEDYLAFVQGLNVGLAPLVDNAFNEGRSDGKFLEYAGNWAAPVLSRVPVFLRHEQRARLFSDCQELIAILEELYDHPQQTARLAETAHAYVASQRTDQAHLKRTQFYQNLWGTGHTGGVFLDRPDPEPALVALLRAAVSDFWGGAHAAALAKLSKAVALNSAYHQGHLWVGKTLNAMGAEGKRKAFEMYAEWTPHPVYADLLREVQVLAAEVAAPQLVEPFLNAIRDPGRRFHLVPPKGVSREMMFRTILSRKPWDYQSLVGLYKILARRPEHRHEARALLEQICFMHPENKKMVKALSAMKEAQG